MEIFDNEYFLRILSAYSNRCNKAKESINTLPINDSEFIKRLKEDDDAYTNTVLAISYHDNVLIKKDDKKFIEYMNKAKGMGSPIAYACLAVCYFFGFMVEKNEKASNEMVRSFIDSITYDTLAVNDLHFFTNLLKEASHSDDKDISILYATSYIELYKLAKTDERFKDTELANWCSRQVDFAYKDANSYGDKDANYNLYCFYHDLVKDESKAERYLKRAIEKDNNKKAKTIINS